MLQRSGKLPAESLDDAEHLQQQVKKPSREQLQVGYSWSNMRWKHIFGAQKISQQNTVPMTNHLSEEMQLQVVLCTAQPAGELWRTDRPLCLSNRKGSWDKPKTWVGVPSAGLGLCSPTQGSRLCHSTLLWLLSIHRQSSSSIRLWLPPPLIRSDAKGFVYALRAAVWMGQCSAGRQSRATQSLFWHM